MTASPRPTVARRGRGNRTPWESPTRTVRAFMRASCGDFTVITATASSQACRCSAGGGDRARGIVWVSAPTAAGKRSLVGSHSQVVPHPIPAPIRTRSASQRPRPCCRHSYQSLRPRGGSRPHATGRRVLRPGPAAPTLSCVLLGRWPGLRMPCTRRLEAPADEQWRIGTGLLTPIGGGARHDHSPHLHKRRPPGERDPEGHAPHQSPPTLASLSTKTSAEPSVRVRRSRPQRALQPHEHATRPPRRSTHRDISTQRRGRSPLKAEYLNLQSGSRPQRCHRKADAGHPRVFEGDRRWPCGGHEADAHGYALRWQRRRNEHEHTERQQGEPARDTVSALELGHAGGDPHGRRRVTAPPGLVGVCTSDRVVSGALDRCQGVGRASA